MKYWYGTLQFFGWKLSLFVQVPQFARRTPVFLYIKGLPVVKWPEFGSRPASRGPENTVLYILYNINDKYLASSHFLCKFSLSVIVNCVSFASSNYNWTNRLEQLKKTVPVSIWKIPCLCNMSFRELKD